MLRADTVYFNGWPTRENTGKEWYISGTVEVSDVTDVMLFVERRKQWILERIQREQKDNF
jgi:hypothetical protein